MPDGTGTDLKEQTREKLAPPPMYRAILANDDFTPREFVVYVLATVFRKSREQALRIMLTAHQAGRSIIGVYTYDVATSRSEQVKQMARDAGYPLHVYVEEV